MKYTTLKSIKEELESYGIKVKKVNKNRELFGESKWLDFLVEKSDTGFILTMRDRYFESDALWPHLTGYDVKKKIIEFVNSYNNI